MFRALSAAAIAAITFIAPASAATLGGTFIVDIYHRTGASSAESAATIANLAASTKVDSIVYNGDLDFSTTGANTTTIGDWLATAGGTIFGLDPLAAALQLSSPNINTSSAVTTFFDITATFLTGFDSVIRHDDGISVFDDGTEIANSANPTTVQNTSVNGFNGGTWRLIYAATNGNPSILKVTGDKLPSPVPLPAGLPLLLAGLGGLAVLRRRSKKA